MIPRMLSSGVCFLVSTFVLLAGAYRYDPAYAQYNLNTNQTATNPLDYWGEWSGHTYTKSPSNWRFPFYTLFLDRFVNGDPTNDNINGTAFEHDLSSSQMRHGGDLQGLVDTLDYLHGMGIKVRPSVRPSLQLEYLSYVIGSLRLHLTLTSLSPCFYLSRTSPSRQPCFTDMLQRASTSPEVPSSISLGATTSIAPSISPS